MMAGDGLLVRVRPVLARMTADQVAGLCAVANRFGNGLIDVTNRANIQIRGVDDRSLPSVLKQLVALDLVDPDPIREARRAILVAPDWRVGDDSACLAQELLSRLDELPDMPAKIGFAFDAGAAPLLGEDSADFRVERSVSGAVMLRADGRQTGIAVTRADAIDALIGLTRWFMDSGGAEAGRMRRHPVPLPNWAVGDQRPKPARKPLTPSIHPLGQIVGVPFGSVEAEALARLMMQSGAAALRVTPWRCVLLEGGAATPADCFVTGASDPILRAYACPGSPACPQATVETRALAARLAPHVGGRLHVSGCGKGCAHAGPCDVLLTGRDGLFELSFNACPGDAPARMGVRADELLTHFGAD
ncbi:MAG: cobalamin biosynthesis protein CobG [Sphingobium sp.]